MRVLVAGVNVRHIACSAARSGHEVYALDAYCDLDIEECAKACRILDRPKILDEAEEAVTSFAREIGPDAIVLGPGLEEARIEGFRVLNNTPERATQVSDKLWLSMWLRNEGFPFIPTRSAAEGFDDVKDGIVPSIVKPRIGAGGVGCVLSSGPLDLPDEEMIIQEFAVGRPASVSVIGDGREAVAISQNEQISGADWAGAEGFRYVGNITPLDPPCPGLFVMAEEIVAGLELIGSNGVDFIITEKGPVVLEVNPRFQGSLDSVEISTGTNIFQAHVDSFEGILPVRPKTEAFGGRAIIYAPFDAVVGGGIGRTWAADIPAPGARINRGDPVASVLAKGKSREDILDTLRKRAGAIRANLLPA